MMFTGEEALTALVFTTNAAVVVPAETVTLGGTVANVVSLLDSDTVTSLAGATVKVTVPLDVLPPVNALGFRPRLKEDWKAFLKPITYPAQPFGLAVVAVAL
jgi:hypothetical protein